MSRLLVLLVGEQKGDAEVDIFSTDLAVKLSDSGKQWAAAEFEAATSGVLDAAEKG